MSIASELQNYADGLDDAYDAVNDMSGIIPQHKNMNNLDQAIRTIPQSSGPTPGDGTLTIQKNGTTVGAFTANQSTNETVDITTTDSFITTFYVDKWPGGQAPVHIYKDDTLQTPAVASDLNSALEKGGAEVVVVLTAGQPETEHYTITSYDTHNNSYDIARYGTVVYGFQFSSTSPAGTIYWGKQELQRKLTAGTNINIDSQTYTISATQPTVNDATLTIQHNGTNVQTFTANQSTNATANIETIYADTIAPASPVAPISTSMVADGAITASKIDFTSFIAGTADFTAVSAGGSNDVSVNIPTQANTDYLIFLQLAGHTAYWTGLVYRPGTKTTTSFTITAYNSGNGATGSFSINYLVIPQ